MDRPPSNLAELRQAVRQAWRAVWARRMGAQVDSMPHHAPAVLVARGEHMCYQ